MFCRQSQQRQALVYKRLPWPPSLWSSSSHPHPGTLNSAAILPLAGAARASVTCIAHARRQRQATRHRVSVSPPEAEPQRRHSESWPLPTPGAPSAASSALAPGSFPRDLHPAGRQPEVEEGEKEGTAQLWLLWGEGRGKLSPHHSCLMEAALSPRTGVWLCCCCFLKRRKGGDEFPDAKNQEECNPLLG